MPQHSAHSGRGRLVASGANAAVVSALLVTEMLTLAHLDAHLPLQAAKGHLMVVGPPELVRPNGIDVSD